MEIQAASDHVSSDGEMRDELPKDLDRDFVGPYRFPDNSRRRITGTIYIICGAAMLVGTQLAGPDAVLANVGISVCGAGLVLVGLYHWATGHSFGVDENQALAAASAEVEFPVGHASAQLGWRGLLSRPTWHTLVFSAEDPPTQRGLVVVDAVDGHIVDSYQEEMPELERQSWPSEQSATRPAGEQATESITEPAAEDSPDV